MLTFDFMTFSQKVNTTQILNGFRPLSILVLRGIRNTHIFFFVRNEVQFEQIYVCVDCVPVGIHVELLG